MNSFGYQRCDISRLMLHKVARQSRGFNLVELMVVIAIVGILAAVAMPGFTGMVASMKAKSTASDLYMALVKTRSEAIKRNAKVTLSVSGNGWTIFPSNTADNVLESHTVSGGVSLSGDNSVEYNSSGRIAGVVSFGINAVVGSKSSERCVTTSLSGLPNMKSTAC